MLAAFLSAALFTAPAVLGQTAEPSANLAQAVLDKAYEALRAKDYDHAIQYFQQAIALAPDRAAVHKDLGYTLLKTGETEAARDQFAEAMRLDPQDDHVALEYAFLCYETRQQVSARRVFDRLRQKGNAEAAEAFERIDQPLREGIASWTRVVERTPDNFSAHEELARLAEQRDDSSLAAEHYQQAWKLRPDRRALLLDLARVWKAQDRKEDANAAWLAASRSLEPRVAEEARERLPARYPYASEFLKALELDPSNLDLRRDLAYLYLEVGDRANAEQQFRIVCERAPDDLQCAAQLGFLLLDRGDSASAAPWFDKVLAGSDVGLAESVRRAQHKAPELRSRPDQSSSPNAGPSAGPAPDAIAADEARQLGEKSLEKGYLKDAVKYLQVAHENNPLDFEVILKLGQAYNMLHDDEEAVRWFNLASRSPDPKLAAEASRDYHNIAPALRLLHVTVWMFPMYSTRWHDEFGYAQAKLELRLPHWFLRPYASLRFIGDVKGAVEVANLGAQYLSERSVIAAAGLATAPWHGATGWFEAGEALRYAPSGSGSALAVPDYRGGIAFGKGLGNLLARGSHGLYAETNDDGIFVSRFHNDMLLYSQNRTGYTLRGAEGSGEFHAQIYWNANVTADEQRQYWANYVETGPGIRFRFEGSRVPLLFSIDALRGVYLVNQGNPRRPNFNDLRIGVWYAFSK